MSIITETINFEDSFALFSVKFKVKIDMETLATSPIETVLYML